MKDYPNYLNEFEQEFELDSESAGSNDQEWANDNHEQDQEWEFEDDREQDQESDYEDDREFENEFEWGSDSEADNQEWGGGYSPDREYENRLFEALNGDHENAFELEQNVDRVLYEMEMDYFWKPLKRLWNKHKGKIFSLAKKYIPGAGVLDTIQKLAGGDLRGFLKGAVLQGAGALIPGGSIIANALSNQETPLANGVSRAQVRQTVQTVKTAFQNQLRGVTKLQPGADLKSQVRQLSRQSMSAAIRQHGSPFKGTHRRVIRLRPGSIVSVHPDRIIIHQR